MQVSIQAGQLQLQLCQGGERLNELLDFASRENHKRGFLFVSKVLGKHIPVKPSAMRHIYDELATLCQASSDTLVVGMAETATGLGAGVADSLAKIDGQRDVYYQHTSRHHLPQPIWLTLDEAHSHAVDHILYQPLDHLKTAIEGCRRLILVDDEISTGRTLQRLIERLLPQLPELQEVVVVSLVSWLDANKQQAFEDSIPLPCRFVHLMQGSFEFIGRADFQPQLPANVDRDICHDPSRLDTGRCGIRLPMTAEQPLPSVNNNMPITVVGTGEHLFLPFLAAEALEQQGHDVLFQSTTRSPILEGDAIQRKLTFSDTGKQVVNFIYNLPQQRQTLVMCEDPGYFQRHGLVQLLQTEAQQGELCDAI